MKKNPQIGMLLHTLAKLLKFSVHTGLDAKMPKMQNSIPTKVSLFRLGFHPYKYAMQYNTTSVSTTDSIKVSKFQKQIFLFSILPKNE